MRSHQCHPPRPVFNVKDKSNKRANRVERVVPTADGLSSHSEAVPWWSSAIGLPAIPRRDVERESQCEDGVSNVRGRAEVRFDGHHSTDMTISTKRKKNLERYKGKIIQ